jgi:L-lactate dehydrogenase complex protein LldG
MSGDREPILARIAEALRTPAPRHHEPHAHEKNSAASVPFREWLPQVGEERQEQIAVFARLSEMLRTEFRECASPVEAASHIASLAQEGQWKRIALHSGALIDAVAAKLPASLELLLTDHGYEKDAMESSDAGFTECESLVAQTGSVCVTGPSSGGRVLSVFPPHHIVIASRGQMLPDLSAAYEHLAAKYQGRYPSFISFITGPSRTGDIERILVLGAHGPKRLTVLLVP